MVHNFDFITEIMGMPTGVSAHGIEKTNSHVFCTLRFKEGWASVESSTMLPASFPFSIGFDVECEAGTITFNGEFSEETLQKMIVYKNDATQEIDLPGRDDYEEAIKHVIDDISHQKTDSCLSVDEAIKSLKLALAVKESLNNASAVNLEL